jgi:hypothetical protein
VGVADDAQVVAPAEPGVEQPLLQRRDVLVLVDDERAVARPELLRHPGVLLERPGGQQQQVVEVGGALRLLQVAVGAVDLGDDRGVVGPLPTGAGRGRGVVLRPDERAGRPVELREQVADLGRAGAQPGPRGGVRDHAEGVLEQPRRGAPDDPRPEVVELLHRGGVEGAGLHAADAERAQPRAHLPRRTGGERDREQGGRGYGAGQDRVRRPVGDRARLPGAGPGEDDHRSPDRPRRCLLLGVEGGEDVVGGQRCGHPDSLPVDGHGEGAGRAGC